MSSSLVLALVAIFVTSQWEPVASHGRLWTPPGRATMWRKGFNTPKNYDDNQMFCGGLSHQKKMGYRCGLCGDPFDSDRPNEAGGMFATGTIAAVYSQGQRVDLQVDLTANHRGWFEFKLCPVKDHMTKATQECLDLHPLQLADGSGTKFYVSAFGSEMITIPVTLPKDLNCRQCVLQWRYHGGNNWGVNADGTSCNGCGFKDQEEFYGCADVTIKARYQGSARKDQSGSISPDIFKLTTRHPTAISRKPQATAKSQTGKEAMTTDARQVTSFTTSQEETSKTSQSPKPRTKLPPPPFIPPHADKPSFYQNMKPKAILKCQGVMAVPGMTKWCYENCVVGNCPSSKCKCHLEPFL